MRTVVLDLSEPQPNKLGVFFCTQSDIVCTAELDRKPENTE